MARLTEQLVLQVMPGARPAAGDQCIKHMLYRRTRTAMQALLSFTLRFCSRVAGRGQFARLSKPYYAIRYRRSRARVVQSRRADH